MVALVVPSGNYDAEAKILEELDTRPEVKSTMGLANIEAKDGYCLTDTIEAAEGEAVNKYFSYLDKEDFADLILWCEQVLAEEYQK